MRIFLHILLLTLALARLSPSANGFALIGVAETWQTTALGFNPLNNDIGFVKGITEGYRWPKSQLSYAFDPTFVAYFGENGVNAVEEAIKVFNRLDAMSAITDDKLRRSYPLNTLQENATARALRLVDLKSFAMSAILEELGLGEPVRWTYAIRNKSVNAGGTVSNYFVAQRNYDPVSLFPTNYVNGRQYKFQVQTLNRGGQTWEDAVEIPIDPSLPEIPSVAERNPFVGGYFTGLTRDDIAGLRHLYRKNNVFNLQGEAGVTYRDVNFAGLTFLTNQDLGEFSRFTITNGPAAVLAQYPGIVITNSAITNFIKAVQAVGITNELKAPEPWEPLGTPFRIVARTLYATNFVPAWRHSFANVFTNYATPSQTVVYQQYDVGVAPWAPIGSGILTTNNITTTVVVTNLPTGAITIIGDPLVGGAADFAISDPDDPTVLKNHWALLSDGLTKGITNKAELEFLSTNKASLELKAGLELLAFRFKSGTVASGGDGGFPFQVILPSLTNVVAITNVLQTTLNPVTGGIQFQVGITLFTNVIQVAFPITTTAAGATVTMAGADKLRFVRGYFDTGLGNSFAFTNQYSMIIYTNGQSFRRTYSQVQNAPDFLFSAADIGTFANSSSPVPYNRPARFVNRENINGAPGPQGARGGPGEINGPINFTFNSIGQGVIAQIPGGSTLESALSLIGPNVFAWGSFDGRTNAPIVYPNVLGFDQLERVVLKKP